MDRGCRTSIPERNHAVVFASGRAAVQLVVPS